MSQDEHPEGERHHSHAHEAHEVHAGAVAAEPVAEKPSHSGSGRNTITIIVMIIILVGILVALVAVPKYLKKEQLRSDQYNHFDFVQREDGFWYTVVNKGNQPYSLPFYYHPREVEDVIVDAAIRDRFFRIRDLNGSIFITLDPDSEDNHIVIAGVEIAKITGERFGLLNVSTRSAFTKQPSSASADSPTPIVTCSQAGNRTMVVWIAVTGANVASSQGNCIKLEAKNYTDTVRVADSVMYHLLGIMN